MYIKCKLFIYVNYIDMDLLNQWHGFTESVSFDFYRMSSITLKLFPNLKKNHVKNKANFTFTLLWNRTQKSIYNCKNKLNFINEFHNVCKLWNSFFVIARSSRCMYQQINTWREIERRLRSIICVCSLKYYQIPPITNIM